MNTLLKAHLTTANVTSINNGVIELNEFFKSFTDHELKTDWDAMNRDSKRKFVKELLNQPVDLSGEHPVDISDTRFDDVEDDKTVDSTEVDGVYALTNENPVTHVENDLATVKTDSDEELMPSDEVDVHEMSEFSMIVQNEINGLLEQIEQFKKHIVENEQRLVDLGYNQVVVDSSKTKMEQMKQVYDQVNGVRKDFMSMVVERGICGRNYSSTAYQLIKKGK